MAAAGNGKSSPSRREVDSRSAEPVRRGGLAPYRRIDEVGPPPAPVYALVDVERGEEFRGGGVPPQDALPVICRQGRTPLTIQEASTWCCSRPRCCQKNACFMLSHGPARRSPRAALWISGNAPKLGWCWDGNPHTRPVAGNGNAHGPPAASMSGALTAVAYQAAMRISGLLVRRCYRPS